MRLKRFQKRGFTRLIFENNGQGKFKKYTCPYGGGQLWFKLCFFVCFFPRRAEETYLLHKLHLDVWVYLP